MVIPINVITINGGNILKFISFITIANIDSNTAEGGWIQNSIDGTTSAMSGALKGMANVASANANQNVPDKFGNIAVENLSSQLREITAG